MIHSLGFYTDDFIEGCIFSEYVVLFLTRDGYCNFIQQNLPEGCCEGILIQLMD